MKRLERQQLPQRKRRTREAHHYLERLVARLQLQTQPFEFNGDIVCKAVAMDLAALPDVWSNITNLQALLKKAAWNVQWAGRLDAHSMNKGYHPEVSTWTNNRAVVHTLLQQFEELSAEALLQSMNVQVHNEYQYVLSMCKAANMTLHYDPLPGVCYIVLGPPLSFQVVLFVKVNTSIRKEDRETIYAKLELSILGEAKHGDDRPGMELGSAPPHGWSDGVAAPLPDGIVNRLSTIELKMLTYEYHRIDAYSIAIFNGGVAHCVWNMGIEGECEGMVSPPQLKIGINFHK